MSDPARPHRPRIVIAACCVADAMPAIRVGTDLATHLNAEILGMLVEDEAIQRAAALPFARALRWTERTTQPITPESMQGAFARDAEVFRQALARTAGRAAVRWSFERRQGHLFPLLREHAGAGDLLLVGHERTGRQTGDIVLIDDLDPVDTGLLDLGLHLAVTAGRALHLFVPGASVPQVRDTLRDWPKSHPRPRQPATALHDAGDADLFTEMIGYGRPLVLLVAASAASRLDLEAIVNLARCPVVIAVDRSTPADAAPTVGATAPAPPHP